MAVGVTHRLHAHLPSITELIHHVGGQSPMVVILVVLAIVLFEIAATALLCSPVSERFLGPIKNLD